MIPVNFQASLKTRLEQFTQAIRDENWEAVSEMLADFQDSPKGSGNAAQRKQCLIDAIKAEPLTSFKPERTTITAEKLAGVNLDPYDTEPSTNRPPPSVPIAYIGYGKLKHTIYFRDSAMPDSEAKPEGVKGCDIYRFIGDVPPASASDYDYVVNDSAAPYVAFYDGTQAGKTVHYVLRWVSKSNEPGEWSQVIKATING